MDGHLEGGEAEGEAQASAHQIGLLNDLIAREHAIHAAEPLPVRRILRRCEGDESEADWGDNIRTGAQREAERLRRLTSASAAGPPVSAAEARR
jgi:hypothetical protein